jgi:hypothetical protein
MAKTFRRGAYDAKVDDDEIWNRIDGLHYDLDGKACSLRTWSTCMEAKRREDPRARIGSTTLRWERRQYLWISTVWLGLDHNWWGGPPLIYETMIFGPGDWSDMDCERYSSRIEAEAGHNIAVAGVTRRLVDAGHTVIQHEGEPDRTRANAASRAKVREMRKLMPSLEEALG